ncbi:MAG: hypothetical protein R3324_03390 [Halobacteriales archaeon]|nr:hypothetical protein [Halobacteriales archaeon]
MTLERFTETWGFWIVTYLGAALIVWIALSLVVEFVNWMLRLMGGGA